MAQTEVTPLKKYTGKPAARADGGAPYVDRLVYGAAAAAGSAGRPVLPPYIPHPDLVEAVNVAIALERPLLIKGEPGSGKTRLAGAVAAELGLPLETWYIKSTTRAREGLYTFDALRRLRDAQLAAAFKDDPKRIAYVDELQNYLHFEALGRALTADQRTVLLIDEIDKADIDFPNDLLRELDEHRFQVLENHQEYPAAGEQKPVPIVFITSNDEKDLPDAFLRRCLFYYIDFPERTTLLQIVQAHLAPPPEDPQAELRGQIINAAVDRFLVERQKMVDEKKAGKKVSTSELLDWTRALLQSLLQPAQIAASPIPFPWVLFKDTQDLRKASPALGSLPAA